MPGSAPVSILKPRDPLDVESALVAAAEILGWAALATAVGRSEALVKAWTDPDRREQPNFRQIIQVSMACARATGTEPPLLALHRERVDHARCRPADAPAPSALAAALTGLSALTGLAQQLGEVGLGHHIADVGLGRHVADVVPGREVRQVGGGGLLDGAGDRLGLGLVEAGVAQTLDQLEGVEGDGGHEVSPEDGPASMARLAAKVQGPDGSATLRDRGNRGDSGAGAGVTAPAGR